jgi:transcriptional regulator with XRE-family HTH domain
MAMDVSEMRRQMGDNLRLALEMKRISQARLARHLGRDAASINRLANGKQDWTTTDMVTFANVLGLADPLVFGRRTSEFVAYFETMDTEPFLAATGTDGGTPQGGTLRSTRRCGDADGDATIILFPQLNRPARTLAGTGRVVDLRLYLDQRSGERNDPAAIGVKCG